MIFLHEQPLPGTSPATLAYLAALDESTIEWNHVSPYLGYPAGVMLSRKDFEFYAQIEADIEVRERRKPKPPSDMQAILDHAAAALDCVGMVCRKQAERGTLRGLGRTRGVRALLAAAARAEGLGWYLSDLAREDHEITLEEHAPILEFEFAKIRRARKTIRQAADLDWLRTDYKNRGCPTFHQLAEVDQVDVNRAAFFAVAVMADAIRFALLGAYTMKDARIRAAEELAGLRGMVLEQPS